MMGILKSMVKIALPSILQQSIVPSGCCWYSPRSKDSVLRFWQAMSCGQYKDDKSICIVPMISGNAMSTFTARIWNGQAGRPGDTGRHTITGGFALLIGLILFFFDLISRLSEPL